MFPAILAALGGAGGAAGAGAAGAGAAAGVGGGLGGALQGSLLNLSNMNPSGSGQAESAAMQRGMQFAGPYMGMPSRAPMQAQPQNPQEGFNVLPQGYQAQPAQWQMPQQPSIYQQWGIR